MPRPFSLCGDAKAKVLRYSYRRRDLRRGEQQRRQPTCAGSAGAALTRRAACTPRAVAGAALRALLLPPPLPCTHVRARTLQPCILSAR
eukprot:364953-Chlamydomonas_euryale.AAC.8